MTTFAKPNKPETQGMAWQNLKAFDAAVMEADSGIFMLITELIERLAKHMMEKGNIASEETAQNQAKQVVAKIVAAGKFDRLFIDVLN